MGMNIKNEEAHQLALEISQATGETLTATVLRALRLLKEKELARPRTPEEKIAALKENGMQVSQPSETLARELREIGETMTKEWQAQAGDAGAAILSAYNAR